MFGYRAHGLTLASEIPLPELCAARASSAACEIRLADPPAADPPWFQTWRLPNRRAWLTFGRNGGDGYLLRFPGLAAFSVSRDGTSICCHRQRGVPVATRRHLLLDQVLPLAISRSHGIVLHASAVHLPSVGAVAFAGPAGAGKSTMAAALTRLGASILSDDCVVIDDEPGGLVAHPGYPGLRLWRDAAAALGHARHAGSAVAHYSAKRRLRLAPNAFRSRASAIRAIVLLAPRRRTGPAVQWLSLAPRDRLVMLTRYLFVLDVADRGQVARTFSAAAALVSRIPVMRLALRDDPRQLATAARGVYDRLRAGGPGA
jgi:hypothetical protein